jgi:hypothetical protein
MAWRRKRGGSGGGEIEKMAWRKATTAKYGGGKSKGKKSENSYQWRNGENRHIAKRNDGGGMKMA